MLGLNKLGKASNRLVSTFETKVREGQQHLEKLLGDTGVVDHAKYRGPHGQDHRCINLR